MAKQQQSGKRCTVGSPDNYITLDNQKCSIKGRNDTSRRRYCSMVSERKWNRLIEHLHIRQRSEQRAFQKDPIIYSLNPRTS